MYFDYKYLKEWFTDIEELKKVIIYIPIINSYCIIIISTLTGKCLGFLSYHLKTAQYGLDQEGLTHHATLILMVVTWLLKFMAGL
jgi:hypothetical protein